MLYESTSTLCLLTGMSFCSVLNAAIRAEKRENIVHAVVFARALNLRRTTTRQSRPQGSSQKKQKKKPKLASKGFLAFFNQTKNTYPCKVKRGELGFGDWRDGEGVGHATWRGGGFRDEFKAFFTPGKLYRVPGVLATSIDKHVAEQFIQRAPKDQPRALWCIRVDGRGKTNRKYRCKHASMVRSTLVTGEAEFLYAPYSCFRVEKVDYTCSVYQIVVSAAVDNMLEPPNLPLAPWY